MIINTIRTKIIRAKIDDIKSLKKIATSWEDKALIEGSDFPDDYFEKCILEGDLPPIENSCIENYRFLKIISKDNFQIIGFLDVYLGYPDHDGVWISIVVIDKNHQLSQYGTEVIEAILKYYKHLGFIKAGVGVGLKNWPSLRFWTKLGFRYVQGVYGDKNYGVDKYAIIGLIKEL